MKKILLVEDDSFLIDIYTTKLKESGFSVEVAPEGDEAIRKVKEEEFDLVLLDIVLPKIDGWDILKQIKAESKLKDLKVIIISNLSQKEEVEKGMNLGAEKYLIKAHYTPSEVAKEIKEVLGE
ncbi:MAG: response regulator [Parcubacteria group bacterium]|nr:MAG: response regulator [Parcubacteria group bacterium]